MIDVRGCCKNHDSGDGTLLPVLDRVDLHVRPQEFVAVLGASGCGKTTLLRIIAGLTRWDAGSVMVDGRSVSGPGPERAMVFQDFALLPWATVIDNIAFGLELRGAPAEERRATARRLAEAVGLAGFTERYPHQLSGGMQQRVGLARALAVDPAILLMDEPFGSLDSLTRRALQEDTLRLHHDTRKTVLLVTHSVDEAARLGDRIVLLSSRPARVIEVIDTHLPRPRPPDIGSDPRFIELKEHLWQRLRSLTTAVTGNTTLSH